MTAFDGNYIYGLTATWTGGDHGGSWHNCRDAYCVSSSPKFISAINCRRNAGGI